MQVRLEENLVEISESAITKLIGILILIPIFSTIIYSVEKYSSFGNEKYIFIVALSFLLIVILSSLLPLINHIRHNGTTLMTWTVNNSGILVADKFSNIAKYRDPIVFLWHDINNILFVDKLVIKDIEGTSVFYRQFVVILNNKKFGDTWLKMSRNSIYKMNDGTHYLMFTMPEPEAYSIIKNISRIASSYACIQRLSNYEIK